MLYDKFFMRDRAQSMRDNEPIQVKHGSPRLPKTKFSFANDDPIMEATTEEDNVFRGYNSEAVNT